MTGPTDAKHNVAPDLAALLVPIDQLEPLERNARKHGERSIKAIAKSLERFGQRKPCVALADGTVIAGNGTLTAATQLGWTHLAVSRFENEADAKAFAIADNRTAELSEWDDVELAEALKDVETLAIGFSDAEIKSLIESASLMQPIEVPADAPVPTTEGSTLTVTFAGDAQLIRRVRSGLESLRKAGRNPAEVFADAVSTLV